MQISAPRPALDYFYEWEAKRPLSPFLRQPQGKDWNITTWQEAGQEARRMAAALYGLGLAPGDRVAILSKNCRHWVIADLALMMGGFVSVPLYPNLTGRQLGTVLCLSEASAIFLGKLDDASALRDGLPAAVQTIAFPHYEGNARISAQHEWAALVQAHAPLSGSPLPALHDLWTILYTSGTTGDPKGVMLDYAAPALLMENERQHNNLKIFEGTEHRFFSYLPLCHIAERIIVASAAMLTGGTISFGESVSTFAQNLRDTQPTLFLAVPRIWTKFQLGILGQVPQERLDLLLRLPLVSGLVRRKIRQGLGLSKARILLTGAAPTPDALKAWYGRLGLPLQEVYAMTENCGGCTLMPLDDMRPGTVGMPLPGVQIKTDEHTGEVLMRAPWLMKGYYKDPEKTAQVLRGGWLHTGDQGELAQDGYLRLTGRVSDTFKSAKGKYIVPGPIEWGFAENNYIEQICVVGLSVPQPLALVVLSEMAAKQATETVRQALAETLARVNSALPNYERVQALVVLPGAWSVENELLTPTMKIRRNVLNKRYAHRLEEWYACGEQIIWAQEEEKS